MLYASNFCRIHYYSDGVFISHKWIYIVLIFISAHCHSMGELI